MLDKKEKLRLILRALGNLPLPGVYQPGDEQAAGSCSNFCTNVCRSLYPLQFTQCFNDCINCQQGTIFETDESLLDEDEK
ncbi:hypothetical protein [Halalkalibacter krulwichiae]|uniref:Uncharacterized protein n=1 Tax=Halalkalibacter krulwichiae TaxID=199441 RepID=A0A1X9MDM2_9BACI|nr:hypothetical protein [Halalkalibacter krulwichiae]ARK30650.1 hypothetical protein BkAM31D_12880 [Halalkalibacter krulwichiae]